MPSDGWPPSDEDAPMHGIVLGGVLSALVWIAAVLIVWWVWTGWTP